MNKPDNVRKEPTSRVGQGLESKVAELSVLYEIANLSFEGSLENFAEEAMKKARRLFSIHGFALSEEISGERNCIACERFWDEEDIKKKIEENKDNHFVYKLGEEESLGVLFMEQSDPIDDSERRLYTIFGRQVEDGFALAKNIKERQRAEERNEILDRIFQNAEEGFYIRDSTGKLKFVSESFAEIHGYEQEEMIGEESKKFLTEESKEKVNNLTIEDVEDRWFEIEIETKYGEKKTIRNTIIPTRDENGEIEEVIGIVLDVTDKKVSERRREFLFSLFRQDMNNKLGISTRYLKLLKNSISEENEEIVKKALEANQEAQRYTKIIEKVKKATVEGKSSINLMDTINQILNGLEELSSTMDVDFTIDLKVEDERIKGCPYIGKLLINFIENRVDKSEAEKFVLKSEENKEWIKLIIEDDGKKIPSQTKKHLTKDIYSGETSGMGGPIYFAVREVVRNYDGSIEYGDSSIGGGKIQINLKKI